MVLTKRVTGVTKCGLPSSWPVYTYTDCIVELLKAGADPTGPCSSQQDNLSSILAYDVDANGTNKKGSSDAGTGKRKKRKNNKANAKKRPASDTTTSETILERSLRLHPRSANHQEFYRRWLMITMLLPSDWRSRRSLFTLHWEGSKTPSSDTNWDCKRN